MDQVTSRLGTLGIAYHMDDHGNPIGRCTRWNFLLIGVPAGLVVSNCSIVTLRTVVFPRNRPINTSVGFVCFAHPNSANFLTRNPKSKMKQRLHLVHSCLMLLPLLSLLLCAAMPAIAGGRREAAALLKWKASLAAGGGGGESLGSWTLEANSTGPCNWRFIDCNLAGDVTRLEISGESLNGTLAELDLSAFPHLETLVLMRNDLYGTIPEGIGNLTRLTRLSIGNNPGVTGVIPRSIGQLHQLVQLELILLVGLHGTIPREIGNLTSLRYLTIAWTSLTGPIPPTVGRLQKLSRLRLKATNLTHSIPPGIANMTGMEYLELGYNLLTGTIPPELGKLSNLLALTLSGNLLSGPFPLALRNISGLHILQLYGCGLTGEAYDIFTNRSTFSPNIPFPGIEMVDLSSNHITGTIPISLCNANHLGTLDLSSNALYGDLPDCLWENRYLLVVDLSDNSLGGVVPPSKSSNITLITSLHLANNRFQGSFPSFVRRCANLVTLDLGGNSFTGEVPYWIAESLPRLRYLRLTSNMFDGVIPQQILQFRYLQLLDLSHNKLNGPIPVDFSNFTGMTQPQEQVHGIKDIYRYIEQIELVWKSQNHVYSQTIAFITGIDLSFNFLSQAIPEGLATLHGLRYLNLSRNHLSGYIPNDIGNLSLLESLDLSWNQLEGVIPLSFAQLKALSTLNLSNNGLSGRIPTGHQLQTLDDPSIYRNNPELCGFPVKECVNESASTHFDISHDNDRESLWLYCFVGAGVIFGFWLSWGILFCKETWRYALCQYVDDMQDQFAKKIAVYHGSRRRS